MNSGTTPPLEEAFLQAVPNRRNSKPLAQASFLALVQEVLAMG